MRNLPFILFYLLVVSLSAQVGERYTEEDINIHSELVKATQKKLLRKYDDAIKIYEGILEKDKNNTTALFDLSRIYLVQDNEDQAISYAEKALKKEPQNAWYIESLAEIKMRFKHFMEAGKMYQELAFAKKTHQNLYLNAIEAYRAADNRAATLSVFETMEHNLGANSYSTQQIVGIYLNEENYKAAMSKAKELIKLYPNDAEYLELNAELEADFGSKKEAEKLFMEVLKIDPENSKALVYLARKEGKSDDDLSSIRKITSNPNVDINAKIKALIPLAESITESDPLKADVLTIASEIVDQHPKEAKAYALYGDLLNNSGNPTEAAVQYETALKYDQSVYVVWEQLMFIQYDLGKFTELSQTSRNALDFYPNQAAPYAFLGLAKVNMEQYDEGQEMLSEATLIGTKSPFVRSIISVLTISIEANNSGDEIIEMSKEDLFMRGIKMDDPAIIKKTSDGKYLVRVKKGS